MTQSFIPVDVLVVGGGVMGLWLLNDLQRAGYSALLLERRELGGEQTCHSHVYLHQGFNYTDAALMQNLLLANSAWTARLRKLSPVYWARRSYWGFTNPAEANARKNLWSDLRYRQVPMRFWPAALAFSAVKTLFMSYERCLDGHWLVAALKQPHRNRIGRIRDLSSIQVNLQTCTVEQVEAVSWMGNPLVFRPNAVVLAAGVGNGPLLDLASGGRHHLMGQTAGSQQIRKAHMLLIRGKPHHLPPLTGVFPTLGGLFIVNRTVQGDSLWLVSDYRSPRVYFVEDWIDYGTRWWLPDTLRYLEALAPSCFRDHPHRLKWGIYEAPKAEGYAAGTLPAEHIIQQFRFKNLWAVWPSKLTLAPKASENVLAALRREGVPKANPPVPLAAGWNARCWPEVAPERWKRTPLFPWNEFQRFYL